MNSLKLTGEYGEDRATKKVEFLRRAGWGEGSINPMQADASMRTYDSVYIDRPSGVRSAILMDAHPAYDLRTREFLLFTRILREYGFSAPEIYCEDQENGFVLLEHLGAGLFTNVIKENSCDIRDIYRYAVDLLLELSILSKEIKSDVISSSLAIESGSSFNMYYSEEEYYREIDLFPRWWLAIDGGCKGETSSSLLEDFRTLASQLCKIAAINQDCLVLRDYHADNLLLLEDRVGIANVGLLDYQDAVFGHYIYDLVSLLQDARYDIGKELEDDMINYYLSRAIGRGIVNSHEEFRAMYHIYGFQRNLKIIGVFVRLSRVYEKHNYINMIPRVWSYVNERNIVGCPGEMDDLVAIVKKYAATDIEWIINT